MVEMSQAVEQIPNSDLIKERLQIDNKLTNGIGDELAAPGELPSIRYNREEMLILEKADLSLLRPDYLEFQFDREGRWDPMAWHTGKPQSEAEGIPVGTLEFRKRSNTAENKDLEVILSPQRMSFGSGCTGSKFPPPTDNKRQNGLLPKNKFDKNCDRTRDPEREKHLQKINGNYSGNREQIRKAIRDLHENRERHKDSKDDEEQWAEYKSEYKPIVYKESKYNGGRRQWNPRRNSERSVDDEPEWFTKGPTSRLDTIELKGFEDDDKIHSTEAAETKDDSVIAREDELAMDPLGNPEMTSASSQYANDSAYSTGLQEGWDPTNPKFLNVDALLDPDAFLEEGKDLLEAEKSINLPNSRSMTDFWHLNNSIPNDFPISPVKMPRPDSSPARQCRDNVVPFSTSEVHFGENVATSNLKAMLGVHEPNFGADAAKFGMNNDIPNHAPASAPIFFDGRNGHRPPMNLDDPIVRQLLHNDRPGMKLPGDPGMMMRPDMMQANNLQRSIRDLLVQRSQSEHMPGGMLPHPGPVLPQPPGDVMFRDPRLHDPRVVDPRLVDPRFIKPEHLNMRSPTQLNLKHGPRNTQELLKAVNNDPEQLDKVISCLKNTLSMGKAPLESQPAMTALLRDFEKAKSDNLKLQTLQILASAHPHHFNKHPDLIIHDKTRALKNLLRLPGQGPPLMTAPARMAPAPSHSKDMMRPRLPGEENIPTRITSHHADHRNMMTGKPGFPIAFTPTSVMIKSTELRNFMKHDEMDPHNINLTPAHMSPAHMTPAHMSPQTMNPNVRFHHRTNEAPILSMSGKKSPRGYEEGPRPVPTIETSRSGVPKLHFPGAPPPNFSHLPMKGLHHGLMIHQAQQLAKGAHPQSPHGGHHVPSQLLMQELLHSSKPFPPHLQHAAANGLPR